MLYFFTFKKKINPILSDFFLNGLVTNQKEQKIEKGK